MTSTFSLFLCIFGLSISGSFEAAAKPAVIFSSNVTTVQIGDSIKLKCQVEAFVPEKVWYEVLFYADDNWFCQYYISAPDSSGTRFTEFHNYTDDHPSLGRQPLSSIFPVYEVTVTPTLAGTQNYWCNLFQNTPRIDVASRHLPLSATPPSRPSALLSSNVTSPLLAQPFTLSCTFTRINPIPVEYLVTFNSQRDGQLATFKVSNGSVLLIDALQPKVDLLPGPKSTFPAFHLVLTEKVEVTSTVYWCDLEEEDKAQVESNTWPALVKFTTSKAAENERVGTCAVGATGLDPSDKAYSVQFLSDLGPKPVNLLGEYIFRPNLFEEFKYNPLGPWIFISAGNSTTWPEFSLFATGTGSLHGTWWCVLAVGVQGTPDYREIKSNIAIL